MLLNDAAVMSASPESCAMDSSDGWLVMGKYCMNTQHVRFCRYPFAATDLNSKATWFEIQQNQSATLQTIFQQHTQKTNSP
jgi:hypothetical protein